MNDNLGDRMKSYEDVWRQKLTPRMPVIIRLDGKSFHSFTKKFNKPFDKGCIEVMAQTAREVCSQIEGVVLGYVQSDEISVVLVNYKTYETQAWFDNNIQKIVSVSAAIASTEFMKRSRYMWGLQNTNFKITTGLSEEDCVALDKTLGSYGQWPSSSPIFDSRAFVVPKEEVANCLLWRQKDWERNSVQMLARAHFSQKQLHKLNNKMMKEKLVSEKGIIWEELPIYLKRGIFIKKEIKEDGRSSWIIDREGPIISQDRNYVENLIYVKESENDACV